MICHLDGILHMHCNRRGETGLTSVLHDFGWLLNSRDGHLKLIGRVFFEAQAVLSIEI